MGKRRLNDRRLSDVLRYFFSDNVCKLARAMQARTDLTTRFQRERVTYPWHRSAPCLPACLPACLAVATTTIIRQQHHHNHPLSMCCWSGILSPFTRLRLFVLFRRAKANVRAIEKPPPPLPPSLSNTTVMSHSTSPPPRLPTPSILRRTLKFAYLADIDDGRTKIISKGTQSFLC